MSHPIPLNVALANVPSLADASGFVLRLNS